jgi:hypothetical protein
VRAAAATADNRRMKVEYVSKDSSGPTYEIEADRHGNYSIRCAGKVVKRVSSVSSYVGRPRWGSKKLELAAIEEAKAAIEAHHRAEG